MCRGCIHSDHTNEEYNCVLWREGLIILQVLAQSSGVARSWQSAVARCSQTQSLHFLSHLTITALAVKGTLATSKDYLLLEGKTGRKNHDVHLTMTLKNKPNWN